MFVRPDRAPRARPDDWEIVKIARHPQRPYTLDYVELMTETFYELHGDRLYAEDAAIVAGLALIDGQTVVAVGHQRGRDTAENVRRNFGMPHPEGFRKALRVMQLAERFGFPVFTFIDTPGAYPGRAAEERNIAGAIAQNIYGMLKLRVPIVATVIGEGGSGGALALGVADRVLMLENATYSVITPEGCASIVFRDARRAAEAARALKMTATHLVRCGVIDEVVPEPRGGAHLDREATARALKETLLRHWRELAALHVDELLSQRARKYEAMGVFDELTFAADGDSPMRE